MIDSGSHKPDIDVAAWRLPAGTALRYEAPAGALRPLVAGYAVLDSDPAIFSGPSSWLLPGSPQLWIRLTAGDILIKARNRRPAVLGAAMLCGPSSVAMPAQSHGGISVVIELTPQGWARLFAVAAAEVRDRVVPLDQQRPADWVAALIAVLHASSRGTEVKHVLDDFLSATLPPPSPHEELIGRVERLIGAAEGEREVSTWHHSVGLGSARTLARTCDRYFGFGPKLLQRRRRFLRAFTAMLIADDPVDLRIAPPGYHDVPHYLRDARHFLSMTPKQFLDQPMAYLRSALRARSAVLGAPVSLLDQPIARDENKAASPIR